MYKVPCTRVGVYGGSVTTAINYRFFPNEIYLPSIVLYIFVIIRIDLDSVCVSVYRELSMLSVLWGKRREGKALVSLSGLTSTWSQD